MGVPDGRAVEAGLAGTRGSVPARRREAASRAGTSGGLASSAGSTAAARRGLALPPGAAWRWLARTLPALRSVVSPSSHPPPAVLGVAHSACTLDRRLAIGRRHVNRRARPLEVDAVFVQPDDWVDFFASRVPHFEVQVRPGRVAPVAHLCDLPARSDLPAPHPEREGGVPG